MSDTIKTLMCMAATAARADDIKAYDWAVTRMIELFETRDGKEGK